MKTCPSCQTQQSKAAFAKNRRTRDGLQTYCRACMAKKVKAYKATPRGRDKTREIKHRQQATPRYKEWRRKYLQRPGVKEKMRDGKRTVQARYRKGKTGQATAARHRAA